MKCPQPVATPEIRPNSLIPLSLLNECSVGPYNGISGEVGFIRGARSADLSTEIYRRRHRRGQDCRVRCHEPGRGASNIAAARERPLDRALAQRCATLPPFSRRRRIVLDRTTISVQPGIACGLTCGRPSHRGNSPEGLVMAEPAAEYCTSMCAVSRVLPEAATIPPLQPDVPRGIS